jgi:two-component system alkaline phosphatase synthesis response regulator PhoP
MKGKAKILLIDDDADFVETTKLVLESKAYEIITASDGTQGIIKARKEKPDLIILDIIMPVKNGFNAAEELKKDPELQKIPVIMLTSFSQKVSETNLSRGQGLLLDTEDYIDKPVAPEELLKRVEKQLMR